MAIALAKTEKTYADYLQAVADNPTMRVELLNGEVVVSPVPRPVHQIISYRLSSLLGNYVDQHQLGQVLFAAAQIKTNAIFLTSTNDKTNDQ